MVSLIVLMRTIQGVEMNKTAFTVNCTYYGWYISDNNENPLKSKYLRKDGTIEDNIQMSDGKYSYWKSEEQAKTFLDNYNKMQKGENVKTAVKINQVGTEFFVDVSAMLSTPGVYRPLNNNYSRVRVIVGKNLTLFILGNRVENFKEYEWKDEKFVKVDEKIELTFGQ